MNQQQFFFMMLFHILISNGNKHPCSIYLLVGHDFSSFAITVLISLNYLHSSNWHWLKCLAVRPLSLPTNYSNLPLVPSRPSLHADSTMVRHLSHHYRSWPQVVLNLSLLIPFMKTLHKFCFVSLLFILRNWCQFLDCPYMLKLSLTLQEEDCPGEREWHPWYLEYQWFYMICKMLCIYSWVFTVKVQNTWLLPHKVIEQTLRFDNLIWLSCPIT